jgi:phosphate uptake regulator
VLCEDDEPAGAEHAGVNGVDDGVYDENKGEAEDLERLLRLSNSGEEPCDESEDYKGVYVVAELERIELEACEESEDSIEAGDFVEEESEEDEFGGGAEGDEA